MELSRLKSKATAKYSTMLDCITKLLPGSHRRDNSTCKIWGIVKYDQHNGPWTVWGNQSLYHFRRVDQKEGVKGGSRHTRSHAERPRDLMQNGTTSCPHVVGLYDDCHFRGYCVCRRLNTYPPVLTSLYCRFQSVTTHSIRQSGQSETDALHGGSDGQASCAQARLRGSADPKRQPSSQKMVGGAATIKLRLVTEVAKYMTSYLPSLYST